MTALKLHQFGGMLPSWDERLLPEGQAALAQNTYLFSGALTGWRKPKKLYELKDPLSQYVYRIPDLDPALNNRTGKPHDTDITNYESHWMEFRWPDTQVLHTPVVDDQYKRFYWSTDLKAPAYNTYERILNGEPEWVLGVPASGFKPSVSVEGGGAETQLGFTSVESDGEGVDPRPGNAVVLVPVTPEGAMLLTSVSFIVGTANPDVKFQAVIYNSDANGLPADLLAVGEEITGVVAGEVSLSPFLNQASVLANAKYWVGVSFDGTLDFVNATASNVGMYFINTYSNGLPDPAPAASPASVGWQIWGDFIGGSVFTARGYAYTYVTEYGEEGPPSFPTVVNGWSNGTWHIEVDFPAEHYMGGDHNLTTTRLYRTVTDQSGQGTYFLVAEFPIREIIYTDIVADDVVSLNSQMVSLYWFKPPQDLRGLTAFPNGITVGYRENELWFSEAYRPHAWPPIYVLTTEFPIVGIGVCGQSIVVCTEGCPYLVSGINPASMSMTKINLPEPCMHKGSIVSTDSSVFYCSLNGLIQVSQNGSAGNVTEGWISRERWQELVPGQFVRAIKLATSYFGLGAVWGSGSGSNLYSKRGFTVELSNEDSTSFSIWPQPGGHRLGFSLMTAPDDLDVRNLIVDPWTGTALVLQDGWVKYWDFTDPEPEITPYKWRSKTYQQNARKNFSAVRVFFNVPPGTPEQVERNIDPVQPVLGDNQYGILRVFVDGQLWTTRELRTSGELLRILSGVKGEQWFFEIESRVTISNIQIATSAKELALV